MVDIGGYSKELCGGCHVCSTAELGLFKIVTETGVAAGIRRIEAIAAYPAHALAQDALQTIGNLAGLLNCPQTEVEKHLRKKHSIKRLTNKQKDVAQEITALIIANEDAENWKGSIADYVKKPVDKNKDRINQIYRIAATHQIDSYLASILFASIKD